MNRTKLKLWQKMLLFCALLMVSQQLFSQVKGIVSDATGAPIPGVTIVEKGTSNGVLSNLDGMYQIKLQKEMGAVLVFSFVGMEKKEIPVSGKTTINVSLGESTVDIDEVVVVGYGNQKKASVVASIATIGAAEIVQSPSSNLTVGMAGKMPGLTIMIKDGELGKENLQTFIRGQATLNSSNPLVLVDGVEREISSIDPYDIESVSILKDASATAVFGVRGANGVIIVSTKKGIVGKASVTANVNYSLQTPTRLPAPLNAVDYMALRNQVVAMNEPASPKPYSDAVFQHYKDNDLPEYYADRNWYNEFMNKFTPMVKADVNLRGGNEKTKYFASWGYMRQGGPFKTERWAEYNYDNSERLDRFTYRANIDRYADHQIT
jgi:TonB-linked SusC/RagA family outer membrane protein